MGKAGSGPKDNLLKLVLSFHYVGPRDWIQVRLGGKSVSTEPSCWPGQPSLYSMFLNSCKHLSQTPLWLWLGLLMATLWMLHTVVISMFLLLHGSCCSEEDLDIRKHATNGFYTIWRRIDLCDESDLTFHCTGHSSICTTEDLYSMVLCAPFKCRLL